MNGTNPLLPSMRGLIESFAMAFSSEKPQLLQKIHTAEEVLNFQNNRATALESLNRAVLFFVLGEQELTKQYLKEASNVSGEITPQDRSRILELFCKLNGSSTTSQDLQQEKLAIDPVFYLPLVDSSPDGIAKCQLSRAVFLFETGKYSEGINACRFGLLAKTTLTEIQQLLLCFFILHSIKQGEISSAQEKLVELTDLCKQKPFHKVEEKLNFLVLSASWEKNPEASALFHQGNADFFSQKSDSALSSFEKAYTTSKDTLLQFCALNNLVIANILSGNVDQNRINTLGDLAVNCGENTRFLFNLNFSSFYPVETALIWAKEIENSEFSHPILGFCFYSLVGFLYFKKGEYPPSLGFFHQAYRLINKVIATEPYRSTGNLKQIICQSLGSVFYFCDQRNIRTSNPLHPEKTLAESSSILFDEAHKLEQGERVEETIHSQCRELVNRKEEASTKTLASIFPLEGLVLYIPSLSLEATSLSKIQ